MFDQNVLIGLDIPIYKANKGLNDDAYESPDIGSGDEIYFEDDDHEEVCKLLLTCFLHCRKIIDFKKSYLSACSLYRVMR